MTGFRHSNDCGLQICFTLGEFDCHKFLVLPLSFSSVKFGARLKEAKVRTTYRYLAYALAVEVVVQAMAIAYGLAGLGKWVDDKHVLTKHVWDSDKPHFTGVGGLALHTINGVMLIPVITLVLLIVSFFAKVPGGTRRAATLVGLVVLQIVLGFALHSVPFIAVLHVLNAFGILVMAFIAGYRTPTMDRVPVTA